MQSEKFWEVGMMVFGLKMITLSLIAVEFEEVVVHPGFDVHETVGES